MVDLLGGIGDLLMLLPAVHGLARRNPGARLRVLTHDPGMYPKRLILEDARHCGIQVLPLDVAASGKEYTVEVVEEGPGPGTPTSPWWSDPDRDRCSGGGAPGGDRYGDRGSGGGAPRIFRK